MAKSVGSVEVQVGAKIDALQTELRKARGEVEKLTATHKREMAKAETASKGFVQSIGGIKTAAAGAALAMAALTRSSAAHFAELDDNARALRVSVEGYQALSQGFSLAGVSEAQFNKSLQRLSRTIGDASRGVETAKDKFAGLGIAFADSNGVARNTEAVLRDVADAISRAKTPAEQASIAMELLGDRTGRVAAALSEGSSALDGFEAAARRMGTVLDQETIAKLAEVDDQIEIMGNQAAVAAGKLTAAFLPAMQLMVDRAAATASALDAVNQFSRDMGAAFGESANQVRTIDDQIANLTAAVDGLRAKGGEALKGLTSPEVKQLMEFRRELEKVKAARDAITDSFSAPAAESAGMPSTAGSPKDDGSMSRTRGPDRLRGIFDAKAAARAKVDEERRLRGTTDYSTGRPDLKNARRGVDEVRDASTAAIDEINRATDNFRVGLTDSLITGATEGFDGMLAGFARTLQQMASDLLSSQLLRLLSSVGGGSSGGGGLGFLGKIGGAIAGAFAGPAGATAGASAGGGSAMSAFFPGFATGGEFKVGGSGGTDSQLVAFRASPDETVSVRRPDQMQGGGATVTNNVTVNGNPDASTLMALKRALSDNSRATIAQIAEMQRRGRFA